MWDRQNWRQERAECLKIDPSSLADEKERSARSKYEHYSKYDLLSTHYDLCIEEASVYFTQINSKTQSNLISRKSHIQSNTIQLSKENFK